jgi:hypothetical protein
MDIEKGSGTADSRPSEWQRRAPATVTSPARVLVVANRTAATPGLLEAVRKRAARSACVFTLLIPDTAYAYEGIVDADDPPGADPQAPLIEQAAGTFDSQSVMELAVPLLEEAAGGEVRALVGNSDPVAAVRDAAHTHEFDEIIVSTLPRRVSRWLRLDLPHKIADLGLPVTTVTPRGREGTFSQTNRSGR